MKYMHIRNLEKYHPSYKDRVMLWAKIHFNMVQGDPDCEMITNETDWGRLIRLIILELQAKKPIPIDPEYLKRKGFDLKKRPIQLTIKMLHNFIEVCTEDEESDTDFSKVCTPTDKSMYVRIEENRIEENKIEQNKTDVRVYDLEQEFENFWKQYPRKDTKSRALELYMRIAIPANIPLINKALKNYAATVLGKDTRYIKLGTTWLNEWEDWLNYEVPSDPEEDKKLRAIDAKARRILNA